ncbi:MAG: ribosomal subunit protein, partial [Pseudomonadota bacterium]
MATTAKNTESNSTESFAALFEESIALQEMRSGEVITAEVISIDNDFVIVNAGLKSESVIKAEEFLNDQGELDVKVGDFVKVAIEKLEDGFGSTILSRDKAKKMQAWLDLEDAMNEGTVVKGFVSSRVKGGLRVSVNGITAFLPGSLVDV